jgi:hypothetical protein
VERELRFETFTLLSSDKHELGSHNAPENTASVPSMGKNDNASLAHSQRLLQTKINQTWLTLVIVNFPC